VPPLQRHFLGALAVNSSVSKRKTLEIQKNSLVMTKGRPSLDIRIAQDGFICDMYHEGLSSFFNLRVFIKE